MYGWAPASMQLVALADEMLADTSAFSGAQEMTRLASVVLYKVY